MTTKAKPTKTQDKEEKKEKIKVGDYYLNGDKYIVVSEGGVEHTFNTMYNAMLYSRMLRSSKATEGRLTYDLDYKASRKKNVKVV